MVLSIFLFYLGACLNCLVLAVIKSQILFLDANPSELLYNLV